MEIFSEKNVIHKSWSAKKFFRPLKLGARSLPLFQTTRKVLLWTFLFRPRLVELWSGTLNDSKLAQWTISPPLRGS